QLAADLQQTKQANQAAEIAREQLQSELQALQKAVTTEKALADKQAEQAQKTQASLDEAKKELAALQAQWTTKENDQQKQRQQFEAALAAAESERQKAVALSEQLAADLQQTKQANQAAEIAREQLQSELQALQKAVTTEKALADKQAQQTQKAQASLDEAKKELATLQAQLTTKENDQQKQRQQFEAALAAAESERQKAVALSEQLAADLQQTKQANQAAEIAREQLQSELQALQKAVTTEKALAEKQAEQAQKTQASLDEAKKELIALQAQLTTKENDQKKQRQQFEAALAAAESERQKAVALAEQQTQQLKTLQAELEQAKQEISLTLENSKKELIAKDKSLAAQQQELISAKKNQQLITEQLQTTEAKLKEHEQWLRNRKKQVEELEQALQQEQQKTQQLQTEKGALAQLESRMEQLFNQQATQIQQATNALGKHVTKSFVDQRQHDQALTGLYQYLEKGEQPLSFDAWSMGVDTLTYLVRQIEQNNYDVIIEFGSGTSTVVMAKAVAQRLTSQRYSQITKNDNSKHLPYEDIESHAMPSVSGSQATTLLDSAEYDLPRQILSFEQDRNYLNQTKQALASHGVSQVVELVLAPLVPSRYSALPSEQKPLFYDCEKQLERLARLFEQRNARILVVVDGPFSPKNNPLIREPALGTVLQYLSAQHLDILLDDSHRSGEQQVLEHWQELCEERGLTYKVQALDVVKGATWVTVRPE
ncbi:hypothetical protein ACBP93_04415, partial [Paenalcaligenes hominis]|uniref:hypothetical protein n=1 Tax=Paenalcaligenes hominis TaxID=643674 RepID=UPI00352654B1